MKIRVIVKLTILLFVLLLSACAIAPVHKVNINAIEANKNKLFKIGIVKVAGRRDSGDNLDRKKNVLQKIPIKEICDVLATNYGLKVNTDFNRTIKMVNEIYYEDEYETLFSENPYWGNKEYDSYLRGPSGDPTIIDENVGDTVS